MDLLQTNIKTVFRKYFIASFGGALVICAYSLVDSIMVGQYEGANGAAALATVMPVWNIILSLGLLFGIGGGVWLSTARGRGQKDEGNQFYTCAVISVVLISFLVCGLIFLFSGPLLRLFGANDTLLPLAQGYLKWIRYAIPLFMVGQALMAFIRNDGAPALASAAVIAGGIFNVVGDYYFIFVQDMGIEGAGLATALGQLIAFLILCSHFFSKRCGLQFVRPHGWLAKLGQILFAGFSTFIVDVAMAVIILLFNRQIMFYFDANVLAIYGVICNIVMTVQAFAYAVGQAAQPIISVNFGAGRYERVNAMRSLSFVAALSLGLLAMVLTIAFPSQLTGVFMDAGPEVLTLAPSIMRRYFLSFPLLCFNICATYYFQAVLQGRLSLIISLLRSLVVSPILIMLLPYVWGGDVLWWVMPIVETAIAVLVIFLLIRQKTSQSSKTLPIE